MLRGSLKSTGYPPHSPVSPSRPLHASLCAITYQLDSIRGQLKCNGTRAETRLRLPAKRTSPFKSAGWRQFSRLLAAEVCASAVVMLDTPCGGVVWRVLGTQSTRQFPLHFPSLRHRVPSHFNWTRLEASWNVMTHAQKPDFVFRRNGRVHLNQQGGRQFSRLLAAEVCASAVVMLDTPCSEVVWRVLATHAIRQFPLYFPSRTSPCAITFQLQSIQNPSKWAVACLRHSPRGK